MAIMIAMHVKVWNFFMAAGIMIGYSLKNMGLSGNGTQEIGESGKWMGGSAKRENEPVRPDADQWLFLLRLISVFKSFSSLPVCPAILVFSSALLKRYGITFFTGP